MRTTLAIVAGFLLWSALWVGGHQAAVAAFPSWYEGEGIPSGTALFAGYLAFSVVCSYLSGWLTSKLAAQESRAPLLLGLLLLLVGIGVQASVWSREPLGYHVVFLALLVPVTLAGGRRRKRA